MKVYRFIALTSLIFLILACTANESPLPTSPPPAQPTATAPTEVADVIFTHGDIVTMDDAKPSAEGIAIRGNKILAVGTNQEVLSYQGSSTVVVDLGGHTLMPGFVDAHNHMLGERLLYDQDPLPDQQMAIEYGITTTAEFYVDESILNKFKTLAEADQLRLHVNLYLLYTTNCGEIIGDWWKAYQPNQEIAPNLYVRGIKIFADGGSCKAPAMSVEYPGGGKGDLFFTQEQLNEMVKDVQEAGFQAAIHALGDRAVEQAQNTIAAALNGRPNTYRNRIEHNATIRPELLPRYDEIGIVPVIFGTYSTCIRTTGESKKFKYILSEEYGDWDWPWRALVDANPDLPIAWQSDYPIFSTINPLYHMWGLVTRKQINTDGSICNPPDWLAAGALRIEEVLPMMTINSAYSMFFDNEIGSLKPGKLADLVILSENPLRVESDQLKDIQVELTMIDGKVEYCATGSEALCPSPAQTTAPIQTVDLIFTNGKIITMDDGNPSAQSIAIREDKIVAIGSNEDILKYKGDKTVVIDLEGHTITPGFIDAHQHRIGDRSKLGYTDAGPLIQSAIEQGWTTIDELYVDEGRLSELRALDQAGVLRLRVTAYLPVMENSAEGKRLGDWYNAYRPGQIISPHVRVAGLKVFTDYDNATILLWQQDDLNAYLLKEHQNGWQLAVKTVSTRSLEMILQAFEYVQQTDPNVINNRGRLEHALFITPDQIARIKDLGLIPIINLNSPGQLVGQPDIDQLIAREPQGSYTPWRSLFQSGILVANGTGFPSFYVDEPSGAPFGSPMHLIYQGVTRVGNLGTQPYPWLLDQTVTVEEAMRSMTINAAYSSFEDNTKGSLSPGKLADLVILSENPLDVPTDQINSMPVLMTMIGGNVEWCAPGSESLCPSKMVASQTTPQPAADKRVTASSELPGEPASNAFDSSIATDWNSGNSPEQWIQIDLGEPRTISAIRLTVAQYPEGETTHQIWGGDSESNLQLLHEFHEHTAEFQVLEFKPPTPIEGIRFLRVVTTQSPSWVAGREIEVISPLKK